MAKLYFYYSAMNAGKSTTLLQSAHNYEERDMRTLLFTPKLDDRFGEGRITSRIGLDRDCEIFTSDDDLYVWTAHEHQRENVSCVLVDEAQFLSPKQVLQLTLVVDKLKIPVIGIGAGPSTDGQIMVIHDLLGVSCLEKTPKFVKDFLKESNSIEEAISNYVKSVEDKTGMKILCPEEIAFKKGYISSDDLYTIAEEYSNSEYGKYLKKLIT